MQIQVEVRAYRNGQDVLDGTITWDGRQLVADPPNDPFLNDLIAEINGDPSGLEYLHNRYRNAYLRVTAPRQVSAAPVGR